MEKSRIRDNHPGSATLLVAFIWGIKWPCRTFLYLSLFIVVFLGRAYTLCECLSVYTTYLSAYRSMVLLRFTVTLLLWTISISKLAFSLNMTSLHYSDVQFFYFLAQARRFFCFIFWVSKGFLAALLRACCRPSCFCKRC
jgi:hypothetical protein